MSIPGEKRVTRASTAKAKLSRCIDWLQEQNSENTTRLSQQNKNDIQFIIQTNAARKKFLLSAPDDDETVPTGVDEQDEQKPKAVPLHLLRVEGLSYDCQWASCHWRFHDYEQFQKHVIKHSSDLHVLLHKKEAQVEYVCLWDVCGHNTTDFNEMVRHINYHSYHARLMAIGFNARATLKLARCDKDSTKRNQLPPIKSEHCCLWTGCDEKFNSIQAFFDHVKIHIMYTEKLLCSWAGCGMTFSRRILLTMHVRSHTGERLIACYHCGQHFACNRKLSDHLRRQNPTSNYACSVCGAYYASDYLLREHTRQHVSMYACTQCDMSAPTPAALATHVRYRHLPAAARHHACPHCDYRAVCKSDLRKHMPTHTRKSKRKRSKAKDSEVEMSDEDDSEVEKQSKPVKKYACHMCPEKSMKVFTRGSRLTTHLVQVHGAQWPFGHSRFSSEVEKQSKPVKKYACHMCPEKKMKVFTRGSRLTTHLVQVHGAQWPFGHSRFRYQISEDGMYRLTTTRYEILEVSKQIVDGYSGPKESLKTSFEFNLKQVAEATESTPKRFEITLKGDDENSGNNNPSVDENRVEITVCDVDEHGNIISTEIIDNSDVVYDYLDEKKDDTVLPQEDGDESCKKEPSEVDVNEMNQ